MRKVTLRRHLDLVILTGAAVRLASFDGLRLLALIIGGGENVGL